MIQPYSVADDLHHRSDGGSAGRDRTINHRSRQGVSWTTMLALVVGALGWLMLCQAGGYAADAPVTLATGASISPDDREALGRLAYAEAGNQGEEGLAAVLYAVLNRLASGRFGSDVTAVIEAPGQFEPVDSAGGHWRNQELSVLGELQDHAVIEVPAHARHLALVKLACRPPLPLRGTGR